MARRRLLLTRPAESAPAFAAAAEAAGFEVIAAPMLTYEALAQPDLPVLAAEAQAALLTSAAAARLLPNGAVSPALPILAVGDATADAARRAGFLNVASAGGDGAALAEMAAKRLIPSDGLVLHLAGEAKAFDIAAALRAKGFDARALDVYRARPAAVLPDAAADALMSRTVDDAAFFSRRSASTFVRLVRAAGLVEPTRWIRVAALSSNVAEGLAGLPWCQVLTAATPTADALLAILTAPPGDGAEQAQ